MHAVEDRKLRRLLFGRVTEKLAEQYRSEVQGDEWQGRMVQLGSVLTDRGIEAEVTDATPEPCRSFASIRAPTMLWRKSTEPFAPWNERCSRRCSGGAFG